MPDRFKESHIRQVPLFQQLTTDQLNRIINAFEVRQYQSGEILFNEGDSTRGMHIFVSGQAVLFRQMPNGTRQSVGLVKEGQYINQNALFQDSVETATLQAVKPTMALRLTRERMANILASNPDIAATWGLTQSRDHHLHDVHFNTQRENEEILLKTRRHWWAYIRWMVLPLIILIASFVLAAFAPLAPLWILLGIIISSVLALYIYLEWRNDTVMITSQRVVRITRVILRFTERRDEVSIDSVQEANAEYPTLDAFARLFNYGSVEILTAGSAGNFTLDMIPNPQKVQQVIIEDVQQYKERHERREQQTIRAEVDRWLNDQPASGKIPAASTYTKAKPPIDELTERTWDPDNGPASPFRTSYPTDTGGVVYRTHWMQWIRFVTMPTLWMVGSIVFMLFLLIVGAPPGLGVISWAFAAILFLVGVLWFYYADWDWRHDYYHVTDNNIVIVNRRPLWLQSENDQIFLKQVDNVVSETSGIWQQLFRYGDVRVSLVGADKQKVFPNVANPVGIQDEISRRQHRMKQREQTESAMQQREMLGEYLSAYHQAQESQGNYAPPPPPQNPQVANLPQQKQSGHTRNPTPTLRDRSRPPIVPRQQRPGLQSRPNNQGYQYPKQQPSPYRPNQRPDAPPPPSESPRPPKFPRRTDD